MRLQIGFEGAGLRPRLCCDFGHELRAVDEKHPSALAGGAQRHLAADALRGAGDHHRLAREPAFKGRSGFRGGEGRGHAVAFSTALGVNFS